MRMNLEDTMLSEICQAQKTDAVQFSFCEVPRVIKFMETGGRMVLARG